MINVTKKISLALSGGGARAAAFHAGILLYLAEQSKLEQVTHISSVSGGTLFTGLLFNSAAFVWPSSNTYMNAIFPSIREVLTSVCLQRNAAIRCCSPVNWRFFLSRANVLAESIRKCWGVNATLGDLPQGLSWSINGSTSETGRRFRFKDGFLGDYELGYADASNFDLASAMAVSAAFPIGIGPLKIQRDNYSWQKRLKWDSERQSSHSPKYKSINIYDGGVYDNLGIEPLFDIGKQEIKESSNSDYIVVSDAGAPYEQTQIPHPLSFSRIARLLDLTTDQTRALRVRCLINFLQQSPSKGIYCQIGAIPKKLASEVYKVKSETMDRVSKENWLPADKIQYALRYKTTLKRLPSEDFDLLSQHGYEAAKIASLIWGHSDS